MTTTNGAIEKIVAAQLEKMKPEKRALIEPLLNKAREEKAAQSASPQTLEAIAAMVSRSDARAATALENASSLGAEVDRLRAIVLEMTSRLEQNTTILRQLRTRLGDKD